MSGFTITKEIMAPGDVSGLRRFLPMDDPVRIAHKDHADYVRLYREKHDIIKEQKVTSILEIGVRAGYSMYSFLSAWPGATYVGMDAENGTHGGGGGPWTWWASILHNRYFPEGSFELRIGDTQAIDELPEGKYDFIHVDGDHTPEGVYHDLCLCWPHVAPGGRLMIDDYTHIPGVAEGVDRWLDKYGGTIAAVDFRDTVRGDMILYKPEADASDRVWLEVATYFLAVQDTEQDCTEEEFNSVIAEWKDRPKSDMAARLYQEEKTGYRAAKWLRADKVTWTKEDVGLAELHLRGGGVTENIVGEMEKAYSKETGHHWTVDIMAEKIQEAMTAGRSDSRTEEYGYNPEHPVPDFKRPLIVGQRATGLYYIGDGYHRAVAMWHMLKAGSLKSEELPLMYVCRGVPDNAI